MPSQLRSPMHSGELGVVIQKIYDDLNSVIESINTDLEGIREPEETTKSGGLAVVKEGDKYSIRGKTEDGWARVSMSLLGSPPIKNLNTTNNFIPSDDIDSLTDGSTGTASDSLVEITGSYVQATIENTVASLAGKINELITVSNTHNDRINTLINKVNDILRRINE